MNRAAALLLPIALAACTDRGPAQPADDHELAQALAGRIMGAPQRCLDHSQTSTTRIVEPDTILYSATQKTLWRNTVTGCTPLRSLSTLITREYGPQLCENDTFRTLEPGMSIPSGECRLGAFVPYTLPDRH